MPKQIPSNELDAVLSATDQFPGGGSIEDIMGALPITLPHRTLQRSLEIQLDPHRLVIGTDGLGVDAAGLDTVRKRRRDEAEIDPPAGINGCAVVFSMAGRHPGIDET